MAVRNGEREDIFFATVILEIYAGFVLMWLVPQNRVLNTFKFKTETRKYTRTSDHRNSYEAIINQYELISQRHTLSIYDVLNEQFRITLLYTQTHTCSEINFHLLVWSFYKHTPISVSD